MFRAGQKVVCIADRFVPSETGDPKKDDICTIDTVLHKDSGQYLSLKEHCPIYFYTSRKFKPLHIDHSFANDILEQIRPKELSTGVKTILIGNRVEIV